MNSKNLPFYRMFIDNTFDSSKEFNQKDLQDACEIAIQIKYFSPNSIAYLFNSLKKRIYYSTKITILDYFLCFEGQIQKEQYLNINKKFVSDNNVIVKFQALLNLSINDNGDIKKVYEILEKQIYPTFFYRLINSLRMNLKLVKRINLNLLEQMISANPNFQKDVRIDLLAQLEKELSN
jgi:hypothetical protein